MHDVTLQWMRSADSSVRLVVLSVRAKRWTVSSESWAVDTEHSLRTEHRSMSSEHLAGSSSRPCRVGAARAPAKTTSRARSQARESGGQFFSSLEPTNSSQNLRHISFQSGGGALRRPVGKNPASRADRDRHHKTARPPTSLTTALLTTRADRMNLQ